MTLLHYFKQERHRQDLLLGWASEINCIWIMPDCWAYGSVPLVVCLHVNRQNLHRKHGSENLSTTEILQSHDQNRAVLFEKYTPILWLDKDSIELEKNKSLYKLSKAFLCRCVFQRKICLCFWRNGPQKQPGNKPDLLFSACLSWEEVRASLMNI